MYNLYFTLYMYIRVKYKLFFFCLSFPLLKILKIVDILTSILS